MKTLFLGFLIVLATGLVFYAGFETNPNDSSVKLLYIGEVPGTTRWQVIYEYQGNQYSQIFKTRLQAESWVN